MTTATKAKTTADDEIAQLRAELEAARAERDAMAAKLEASKGAGRAPTPFPADHLAPEGSSLRFIQDKPRGEVYEAGLKILRAIPVETAFEMLHKAAEIKAKADGKSVQDVFATALEKKERGPRKGKDAAPPVVGDATA